jgi:broad specificity phosphatase PhoE
MSLSTRGRLQAARVAERPLSLWPQVLYSSDLRRTLDAAEILRRELGLPVRHCEGLREWNIGAWHEHRMCRNGAGGNSSRCTYQWLASA